MFEIKLCQSRDLSPHSIEHELTQIQNQTQTHFLLLQNQEGKIHFYSSKTWAASFPGSSHKAAIPQSPAPLIYSIKQSSLFPIKRHSQFEDRVNKSRIFPMNKLIEQMSEIPNANLLIRFNPASKFAQDSALKKAKSKHFKSSRKLDHWESNYWFKLHPWRWISPLLRRLLSKENTHTKETQEQTQSTHEREDPKQALLDKLSRPLFEVQITSSHPFPEFFHGFNQPHMGSLRIHKGKAPKLILSAEELSSLILPPQSKEKASLLNTESTAYLTPPKNPFHFQEADRKRHLYLLGKTGMGKSSTLLQIIQEDLKHKRAMCILDPHGDLIDSVIKLIPESEHKRCILIDPSHPQQALALNPFERSENPSLQAAALLEIFKALSQGSWGPRLEYILRNAILTLVQQKNRTLLDIPKLLQNPHPYLSSIQDPVLKHFWRDEFLSQDSRQRKEAIAPILNKVGPLIMHPLLRPIFAQPKSKFNFNQVLKNHQIVLIKLNKGQMGDDASRMLGMVFLALLQSALLSQSSLPFEERSFIATTLDEFQNFCTPTLLSMLSECRKYGLALTLANQYLTQLPEEIQEAVLGNVGSQFIFQCSQNDAEKLSPALGLETEDLTGLEPLQAYCKRLRNQQNLPLFRCQVPITQNQYSFKTIPDICFHAFTRPRALVEAKLCKSYTASKP